VDHSMMNVFCLFAAQVEFFEFFVHGQITVMAKR